MSTVGFSLNNYLIRFLNITNCRVLKKIALNTKTTFAYGNSKICKTYTKSKLLLQW